MSTTNRFPSPASSAPNTGSLPSSPGKQPLVSALPLVMTMLGTMAITFVAILVLSSGSSSAFLA